MGASLSSGIYQYKVDGHLEEIDHCVAIANDIVMYGFKSDGSDHGKTVKQVMQKAKEVGMRFNPTKCQFHQTHVKFFVLMLTRQGVVPDMAKIKALSKLPEPKMENLLQSFLGIVNYLSRFDPQIESPTHNLRTLLKKQPNEFIWTSTHTTDFKQIIEVLCKEGKLLHYYRPDLDLYLETDMRSVAIGMALLQSETNSKESLYLIAYGSKSLTDAETRYANIEHGLLGVVGALEKFTILHLADQSLW